MCASLSSRSRCSPVASVLGEDLLGQLGVRGSSLVGAKGEACKDFRIPGSWKGHGSVHPSFCAADKVSADNFLSITLGPQRRSPPPTPKCFSCSVLCWACEAWQSKVKVAQSCLTLWDPTDYTVHGSLQARTLEWVSLSLLQGIFPIHRSNPGLLHYRQILLSAEPHRKPKGSHKQGLGSSSLKT